LLSPCIDFVNLDSYEVLRYSGVSHHRSLPGSARARTFTLGMSRWLRISLSRSSSPPYVHGPLSVLGFSNSAWSDGTLDTYNNMLISDLQGIFPVREVGDRLSKGERNEQKLEALDILIDMIDRGGSSHVHGSFYLRKFKEQTVRR